MAQRWSRFLTALRHINRAPEVLRCIRGCRDWSRIIPAYLGLRSMTLPVRIAMRAGVAFDFEEFYDLETMWQIFCRRVYTVRSSDRVIVDAGANIGLFACLAAMVAPHSVIHAIEPMPSTFARLVKTVRDNGFEGRVRCYSDALSSRCGQASMVLTSSSQAARMVDGAGQRNSVVVTTTTLASVVERLQAPAIDLLKMDIESSEYEVVQTSTPSTLRRFRRIVVEYHAAPVHSRSNRKALQAQIVSAGFRLAGHLGSADYGILQFTQ